MRISAAKCSPEKRNHAVPSPSTSRFVGLPARNAMTRANAVKTAGPAAATPIITRVPRAQRKVRVSGEFMCCEEVRGGAAYSPTPGPLLGAEGHLDHHAVVRGDGLGEGGARFLLQPARIV